MITGPSRAEGIESLPKQHTAHLHLSELDDPFADVIAAGIAEHMVKGIRFRDASCLFAYNDRQFTLVMHLFALVGIDDRLPQDR